VDGSLREGEEGSEQQGSTSTASSSRVPSWRHGHFSFIYDGTGHSSRSLFLDHDKKTYQDLKGEWQGDRAHGAMLKARLKSR
jgi:hypothetical protein